MIKINLSQLISDLIENLNIEDSDSKEKEEEQRNNKKKIVPNLKIGNKENDFNSKRERRSSGNDTDVNVD